MQPNIRLKTGVINTTGSQVANVISTNSLVPGHHVLMDGSGGNIALFPPIPQGSILKIEKKVSAPEAVQIVGVGRHTETLVANTRYTIGIESPKGRISGSSTRDRKIFAYVTPAALGSQASERSAMYTALANKINAYVPLYTKAQLLTLVDATGAAGITTVVPGDRVGQGTLGSTWKGIVISCIALTATTNQLMLVYTISGTLAASTVINKLTNNDGTDTAITTTAVALTAAQGIAIYDQGGYFSWKDKLGRGGAPFVYSSPTFLANRPTIVQAAISSHGIGTDMLAEIAEYDITRQNVDRGNILRQWNQPVLAASTYTTYTIRFASKSSPNAIDGSVVDIPAEYTLYLKEDSASNPNATTDAAILELT